MKIVGCFLINLNTEVRHNDSITKIWLCKVMSEKMGWQVTKSPPLNPPLDITNVFWVFWQCLARHTQGDTISCRKLLGLSAGKKPVSFPMLFWRYCKDMQTSYFRYFGQNDSINLQDFNLYLYAKNMLNHSLLSQDITF